jgi:hypothetical protein
MVELLKRLLEELRISASQHNIPKNYVYYNKYTALKYCNRHGQVEVLSRVLKKDAKKGYLLF